MNGLQSNLLLLRNCGGPRVRSVRAAAHSGTTSASQNPMTSDTGANTEIPATTQAEVVGPEKIVGSKEYLTDATITIQFVGPVDNPVDKVRAVRREMTRVVLIPTNYPNLLKLTIADLILLKHAQKPVHIVHRS